MSETAVGRYGYQFFGEHTKLKSAYCYKRKIPVYLTHADSRTSMKIAPDLEMRRNNSSKQIVLAADNILKETDNINDIEEQQIIDSYIIEGDNSLSLEYLEGEHFFNKETKLSFIEVKMDPRKPQLRRKLKSPNLSTLVRPPSAKPSGKICRKPISKGFIQSHRTSHGILTPHHRESYKCICCSSEFQTVQELQTHVKLQSGNDFQCGICGSVFKQALKWSLHMYEHSKIYVCPICGFQAKTELKHSIVGHIKRHEGNFAFLCKICGQGFLFQVQLNSHMEMHMAIPKYKCNVCDKTFTVERYLTLHRRLNHQKELFGIEESFQCEICGRKFTFEKSLRRHLSLVHKKGQILTVPCPVCKKIISNDANLKKHMRIHTGEKRFCCDLCGKAFAEVKYWKKHKNVHVKEKLKASKASIEVLSKAGVNKGNN